MAYYVGVSVRVLGVQHRNHYLKENLLETCRTPLSFHRHRAGCSHSNSLSRARYLVSKAQGYNSSTQRGSTETENEGDPNALLEMSEDDDNEFEEVEFEYMLYDDLLGSEWKIGDLMEGKKNVKEYWFRLLTNEEVVWGDNSKGKWKLDERAQFLTISKESFGGWLGKSIWACNTDDYYFTQGTIRGWNPLEAATVKGQWQAKRLGCTDEERGIAPWFQEEYENDEQVEEKDGVDLVRKDVVDDYLENPLNVFTDDISEDTERWSRLSQKGCC